MNESTAERWLPVPGFEEAYEVSDLGRVRSKARMVRCGYGKMRTNKARIRKLVPNPRLGGRLALTLQLDCRICTRLVAPLVLEAFVGPRPEGCDACHNNGICTDDRLENLRWDTRSANLYDCVRHGNHAGKNKDVCPLGHPLALPNLVPKIWNEKGHRRCWACAQATGAKTYAKKMGRAFDMKVRADLQFQKIMGEYY